MTAFESAFFVLSTVAVWATLLYRLADLRGHWRDPSLLTLCVALAFVGVAFTVSIPPVSAAVDRFTGIPNLGAFLIHVNAVAYSFTMQVLLEFWANPARRAWPRVATRLVVLATALIAMLVLFVAAGIRVRSPHFLQDNAANPIVAAYSLVYLVALSAGLLVGGRMCWRYARIVGRAWVRRGLRITTVGNGLSLVYCSIRFLDLIGDRIGIGPTEWQVRALVPLFSSTGSVVSLCGLTMPNWGPRLSAARRWVRDYRALRRLYPLWAALYEALPEIALDPPSSRLADRLAVRRLDLRLCRRVVEIRDGQLALAPYAVTTGSGPAAEAAALTAALHARAAGRRPVVTGLSVRLAGGDDLAGEVAWLTAVAAAFTHPAGPEPEPALLPMADAQQ